MDRLLTISEAAAILQVSRETMRKMVLEKKIRSVPVGMGRVRVSRRIEQSALDDYVSADKRRGLKAPRVETSGDPLIAAGGRW